jgi:hypothetical protein
MINYQRELRANRIRIMLGDRRAMFRGKHNVTKARVFFLLVGVFNWKPDYFLKAKQVADESGCGHDYLRNRLPYWHKWGYLRCRMKRISDNYQISTYAISQKGIKYASNIPADPGNRIMAELNSYRAARKANNGTKS